MRYGILLLFCISIGSLHSMFAQTEWTRVGAINGANVRDIHRAINGDLYAASFVDLYRSTDNGASWSMIFTGSIDSDDIQTAVTFDLEENIAIYIIESTDAGGALVSFDQGATWREFALPTEITQLEYVNFKGSVNGQLYVWGISSANEAKLYSSRDNGANFIEELSLPDGRITDVTDSPEGAVFVLVSARVYRKLPVAQNWEPVETIGQPLALITTAFEETILVSDSTAQRSLDYGDTWENVGQGLSFTDIYGEVVLSYNRVWLSALSSGSILMVGELPNNDRLLHRLPHGETFWETFGPENMPFPPYLQFGGRYFTETQSGEVLGGNRIGLTVLREDSRRYTTRRVEDFLSLPIKLLSGIGRWLFAATFEGDVFRSSDGGETWESLIHSIFIRGDSPVYALYTTSRRTVLVANDRGVFQLEQLGSDFEHIFLGGKGVLGFYETLNGYIYMTWDGSPTVYRSDDDGTTWSNLEELPSGFPTQLSETSDGSIILSSSDGLWKLEDNDTWTRFALAGNSLKYALGSRSDDDIIVLGEQNQTDIISRGDAEGISWESIPIGLSVQLDSSLIIDAVRETDDGVLCAAWEGMFYLASKAQQWREDDLSLELGETELVTALHAEDGVTYAATSRGVTYKRDVVISAIEDHIENSGAHVFAYPQPARDRVTIAFHSAAPGVARITLYNALGAPQLQTDRIIQTTGAQSLRIDTHDLVSGVYTVHVSTERNIFTGTLVIVR